jgi:IS5 family transposase
LIERIVAQSERRVLHGEPSPAAAKLVSLVEPHADIIRKGREVAYGHKLNFTTGRSGLILDLVIEAGNPADSERLLPMLEATARSMVRRVRPPPMAATPGEKSAQAKARGVRDMAFPKGEVSADMVRSRWAYRKLRNFRAGIEANISCLKRAYGLARAPDRARPLPGLRLGPVVA